MVGIYIITNTINGKSYVGQSTNIKKRLREHKATSFNPSRPDYDYPLYRAIRKYGIKNFAFSILEECKAIDLNEREAFYVKLYDSYKNGYNQNEGGGFSPHKQKLSQNDVDKIIKRLRTSLDLQENIAKDFGVTARAISEINNGKTWHRDNESYPIRAKNQVIATRSYASKSNNIVKYNECVICGAKINKKSKYCVECAHHVQRVVERPDRLILAKQLVENSFLFVGKLYGVSDNAVRKWCKQYGLPVQKSELEKWYSEQINDLVA